MADFKINGVTFASENQGQISFGQNVTGINSVLQAKSKSANYNFGTIGNNTEYHCSWLDISLTVKQTGSKYFLSGIVPTDDTNSSAYGVGGGFMFVNDTAGGSWWIRRPPNHESYNSAGGDHYFVATATLLWDSVDSSQTHGLMTGIQVPTAGQQITFKYYIRTNNGNMTYFGGNDITGHCQHFTVWEIA